MFWLLVGKLENGDIYPDYDHFTVYEGEKSADLIKEYAAKFSSEARACLLAPATKALPSPFVRVRHLPEAEAIADLEGSSERLSGWLALR